MRYEIRRLTLGGILDQAIALSKNHFGTFLGITAVTWLPCSISMRIAGYFLLPRATDDPAVLVAAFLQHGGLLLWLVCLSILSLAVSNGAIVYAIANNYLGKPVGVLTAVGYGIRRFPAFVWTFLLYGVAIVGGYILLILPGMLASFWFAMSLQVVLIEDVSGFSALKRSRTIMRGNVGTFFVLSLVVAIIIFGVNLTRTFLPSGGIQFVVYLVVETGMSILSSATFVVFYFSARCRNERFDLQLLAANIGQGPPVGGTSSIES